MDLIEKLKQGKSAKKAVIYPDTEEAVYLRILSDADIRASEEETDIIYQSKNIKIGFENIEERNHRVNVRNLWRALVNADGKKIFDKFSDFEENATADFLSFFGLKYAEFAEEQKVSIAEMDEEELDKIYEEVKKNPQQVLNITDFSTLRKLVIISVSRQPMPQTDN